MPDSKDFFPVDGHVHIHPNFDLATLLAAAERNLAAAKPGALTGMLMLTEISGVDRFAELEGTHGRWQVAPSDEAESVIARNTASGAVIALVSGRQIVVSEGLEVLALGTRSRFDDRRPLRDTLRSVTADGALAVLPWGFGKWLGQRGKTLAALVEDCAGEPGLFIADSGVRPALSPRPGLLTQAERLGWQVLSGTDPLALPGEEQKPGRHGFLAPGHLSLEHPFTGLRSALAASDGSPMTYGPLESPARFLRNQLMLRVHKSR